MKFYITIYRTYITVIVASLLLMVLNFKACDETCLHQKHSKTQDHFLFQFLTAASQKNRHN